MTSSSKIQPAAFNPQLSCPLFTRIPAEIRTLIFEFALTAYNDLSQPYPKSSYYYRPDYGFRRLISTSLLRTCRLIHHEACLLPVAANAHTFWCQRPPPEVRHSSDTRSYFELMSPDQRAAVQSVHLFTQQFWLESSWREIGNLSGLGVRLKHLKITLRRSDWWWWEGGESMGIDPRLPSRVDSGRMGATPKEKEEKEAWGAMFWRMPGLVRFEMELETVERDKAQLDAIAKRALGWKFQLPRGKLLVAKEGAEPEKFRWEGLEPSGYLWGSDEWETSQREMYYVVKVVWCISGGAK